MERYGFVQDGDKYSILVKYDTKPIEVKLKRPDRKVPAKDLSLTDLIQGLQSLYEEMPDPEHRNPDELPEKKGIELITVSYDDNSKALLVLNLCNYLNDLHNNLMTQRQLASSLQRKLDDARRERSSKLSF